MSESETMKDGISFICHRMDKGLYLQEPVALVSVSVGAFAVGLVIVAGPHALLRARTHTYGTGTSGMTTYKPRQG